MIAEEAKKISNALVERIDELELAIYDLVVRAHILRLSHVPLEALELLLEDSTLELPSSYPDLMQEYMKMDLI